MADMYGESDAQAAAQVRKDMDADWDNTIKSYMAKRSSLFNYSLPPISSSSPLFFL